MKEIIWIDDIGDPPTPEQLEKMKVFLEKCPDMSHFSTVYYKGELLKHEATT